MDDLCEVMLRSLDFDRDHMYQFCMDNNAHSRNAFISGSDRGGKASTKEKLYKLGLKTGKKFLFIYDFGDDWTFQMEVLTADNKSGNIRPEVLESIGTVEQYPDWEEEESGFSRKNGSEFAGHFGSGADVMKGLLEEDELDLSEEYFDDGAEDNDGSNPRLGRIVLRITEHQIETKKPAFVGEAYVALQKKGYIRKLAKVKLATALINEIFEIMKYNKPHSEERYRSFVDEAVREKYDEGSVIDIETGREHTIADHLYDFEDLALKRNIMENSRLALSGYNEAPNSPMSYISGSDVLKIRKIYASTVFLDACLSGHGSVGMSGSVGLAEAFYLIGAKNIICYLESVEDNVATRFSNIFYTELSKGASCHDAFFTAKRKINQNVKVILWE